MKGSETNAWICEIEWELLYVRSSIIIFRFTSSLLILKQNAVDQLSEVAKCGVTCTQCSIIIDFRLIPCPVHWIISAWSSTDHNLPKTTECIRKPNWIHSDQKLTLIWSNPASGMVCQRRLSWWHLMFVRWKGCLLTDQVFKDNDF